MKADIAVCRDCGRPNVTLHADYHDGAHHYWYSCSGCGCTTPERPQAVDAAADVDWLPPHQLQVR